MIELTAHQLQDMGRAVGFDAIGATSAEPFPEMSERLVAYDERGRTGFEHADITLRVTPQLWMPQAKSLIAVAMAYLTKSGHELARKHPADGLHGQVTVYSYGQDYHAIMQSRLAELKRRIEQFLGRSIQAQYAVDTAPMIDRVVAERAGIGWVGKNCMFYSKDHGSFVFLGTLAVDVEIEPAQNQVSAPCQDCTLCMDACPTGALIAPGVIEAKRCLSYVTQMKGVIPASLRSKLGRRVWGCDTCQWACPENRMIQYAEHEAYLPHGELEYPDLLAILTMSNREFQQQYGHTAAAWRGLATWKRNALIALGNARNHEAVPHIVPFLQHARPELRMSAAWALQQIGDKEGQQAVREAFAKEEHADVRAEMQWAADSEA